ncbi:hypothetical protein N7468_003798 [Penicillium chermesinum]|uniref:Saccharopine dehydrogenase NADP binding domain-containing protein n=1 Tax=Penicillium chermesinum TaxID=63820 RepID=A0A9W9P736_9EURO|nr:uncharacterized protein N7468_003798 [Penicillium chermesinum]KAJ5239179.1 hypothetical protein N7468_003798 [Penicillium chermesinum]
MASTRQYDLVVLGPTGYTGRFCAEHIVKNLPTDLKWAIAGRSPHKIEPIAKDLKALNPDRLAPDVLAVSLDPTELAELAQKTRLIINCIGPYILYGTPVVEACAKNGTHYVDVTGETPWIRLMVEKYHETAKANGSIIIPSLGFESVPADMLAWSLVKRVREDLSSQTRSIESCIKKIKSAGASGGTLNSIFSNFEALPVSQLFKGFQPFSLAVSTPPKDVPGESILEKLLGVRYVRDLGTLTTSPNGMADMAIVHRSSSLMSELYGKRFYFRQLLYVRSYFLGVLFHVGFNLFMASLLIPPVRWLLRRVVYAPGAGPSLESTRNDYAELNAVATADQNTPNPKRVFGKWYFQGSQYVLTGLLVAEAAMVILNEEDKVRKVSRGGIVTSATLGQAYVDRLDKVGVHIETKVLED